MTTIPVLLAGGIGQRLWPLSRAQYPKQFYPLVSQLSLLQETAQRVAGICAAAPVVLTHQDFRFIVREQLQQIGLTPQATVLEPCGRGTAASLITAALYVAQLDPQALLAAFPTDHFWPDAAVLKTILPAAETLARAGHIVCLGLTPTYAETGFGYIAAGEALPPAGYRVASFSEKPDAATAAAWVAGGTHWWNMGVFIASATTILQEAQRHCPQIYTPTVAAWQAAQRDLDFIRLPQQAYSLVPALSFDHAVMQATAQGALLPLQTTWSDLGSWHGLWQVLPKNEAASVTRGDVILHNSRNAFVRSDAQLTVVSGLDDIAVVTTSDAVLVTRLSEAGAIRSLVQRLADSKRPEAMTPAVTHRPWGSYEVLEHAAGFLVKRITVRPGQRLSLQRHQHRAEHWVVVAGVATVHCAGRDFTVLANQSTYIPAKTIHRLSNQGVEPLQLIEIQTGALLAEDDIERLSDDYGRPDIEPAAKVV